MGHGMKFLQQLVGVASALPNSPKHQSVGYDLNIPVPNSPYKSWLPDAWYRDRLELGLYCCQQEPNLAKMLVDYYVQVDTTDVCSEDWVTDGTTQFNNLWVDDWQRRQLVVLAQLMPVAELTNSIARWFPSRQQTERHTLLMLYFCTGFLGEVMGQPCNSEELPTIEDLSRDLVVVMGSSKMENDEFGWN
jgi:hypothetical protein